MGRKPETEEEKEAYRKYQKEYQQRRRDKAKAEGMCMVCFKRPPEEGVTRCKQCSERDKELYIEHRAVGMCTTCPTKPAVPGHAFCLECKEQQAEQQKAKNDEAKKLVFEHYGGWVCACCGETEPLMLQLDHVDNNGGEDRRKRNCSSGTKFYKQLVRDGFPEGFQVLCCSCNWGKRMNNGVCPHQTKLDHLLAGVTPEMREGCWGGQQFTCVAPGKVELTSPDSVIWKPTPPGNQKELRPYTPDADHILNRSPSQAPTQ